MERNAQFARDLFNHEDAAYKTKAFNANPYLAVLLARMARAQLDEPYEQASMAELTAYGAAVFAEHARGDDDEEEDEA